MSQRANGKKGERQVGILNSFVWKFDIFFVLPAHDFTLIYRNGVEVISTPRALVCCSRRELFFPFLGFDHVRSFFFRLLSSAFEVKSSKNGKITMKNNKNVFIRQRHRYKNYMRKNAVFSECLLEFSFCSFYKCNFPIKMTSREENRLWHCTKRQVSSDFWLFEWVAAQPAEVQGRASSRLALQQLWQKNYRENVESFLEFSFLDIWFHWKITFFFGLFVFCCCVEGFSYIW